MAEQVWLLFTCWLCERPAMAHPDLVPTVQVNPATNLPLAEPSPDGVRVPLCRDCVTLANEARARVGSPLWHVDPDAYPSR